MEIENAQAILEAQRPAYQIHINKHSQYADRPLPDIQRKYQYVKNNCLSVSDVLSILPLTLIGVGIPIMIACEAARHYYKKRVVAYEAIFNFRLQQQAVEQAIRTRDSEKPILEAGIAMIEQFMAEQASLAHRWLFNVVE